MVGSRNVKTRRQPSRSPWIREKSRWANPSVMILLHRCGTAILPLSAVVLVLLQYSFWGDNIRQLDSQQTIRTGSSSNVAPTNQQSIPFHWHLKGSHHATIVLSRNATAITGDSLDVSDSTKSLPVSTLLSNNRLSLRFDWTNLTPIMDLTHKIEYLQSDCSRPMADFAFRTRYGLGSDLHMYTRAVCNALERNTHRVRTVGNWTWMDRSNCRNDGLGSPVNCYFALSELRCPKDLNWAVSNPDFDVSSANISWSKPNGNIQWQCPSILGPKGSEDGDDDSMIQLATMEYLFSRVTPLVYQEATRQLNLVFSDNVPNDLITVHIRWGDKVALYHGKHTRRPEMKKIEIHEYMDAVRDILSRRRNTTGRKVTSGANVYLATEDPAAVEAFRAAMPPDWNLFVDRFLVETQDHRVDEYNGHSKMARQLNGKPGLLALASLLVAMEGNDFVLTTGSNWSRLMNELRRAIVDPRCGNCTTMIDLQK
ncbi:hypothetical protein IV203_002236 [Nitzschia inconspicua]|uniref:Uncharacterized protein n=1 Tax=Nitzschia inconspicua TaxID=303405 RepID=A0A9K3L8W5_9STRA|nr:hypothetical protein IV203_002236 [Nitzschia inconspicua]